MPAASIFCAKARSRADGPATLEEQPSARGRLRAAAPVLAQIKNEKGRIKNGIRSAVCGARERRYGAVGLHRREAAGYRSLCDDFVCKHFRQKLAAVNFSLCKIDPVGIGGPQLRPAKARSSRPLVRTLRKPRPELPYTPRKSGKSN